MILDGDSHEVVYSNEATSGNINIDRQNDYEIGEDIKMIDRIKNKNEK